MVESWETSSAAETEAVGEAVAGRLRAGDLLILEGELGAGKTTLVRGLARGLGADPSRVQSPTFTLVRHYPGRVPLAHLDLYRLDAAADLTVLGIDELLEDHVVAVEWGERLEVPGVRRLRLRLEATAPDRRRLELLA